MVKKEKTITADIEYNKKNLIEFGKVANNGFRYIGLIFVVVYTIISIILLSITKKIPNMIIVSSLIIIALVFYYDYYAMSLQYKRMRQNNNDKDVKLTLNFKNNLVTAKNKDTNGIFEYQYENVKKIVETKKMLVIFFKYGVGMPIMKENTNEETIEDIKKVVINNNNRIKYRVVIPYYSWILLIPFIINIVLLIINITIK